MNKYLFKFFSASAMFFSYLVFLKWKKGNPVDLTFLDFLVPIFVSAVIVAGDMFWDRRDAKKKKMEN
jgi:hypothetical protein